MPPGAEPTQRLEQPSDVGFGQGGRRLVEDEHVRPDGERAADGDERAFGGRQRGDRRLRVDLDADRRQRLDGRPPDTPPGNEAEGRARIAGLDGDVLGDRHPVDEAEILVDEGDARGMSARSDGPARQEDLAGIGGVHARPKS